MMGYFATMHARCVARPDATLPAAIFAFHLAAHRAMVDIAAFFSTRRAIRLLDASASSTARKRAYHDKRCTFAFAIITYASLPITSQQRAQ